MARKTATPDELAKVWGELNTYRVLLFDLYRMMLEKSSDPDDVDSIKQRSYELVDEMEFPPQHQDMRSAAKASLDHFWHDFEDGLKKSKE